MLDRAKMKFLLSELGRLIAEQGKIVEIAIYGGSALILQFDFRKASEDIDYLPTDWNDEFLLDCLAAQLAKGHGLEPGWFNAAIKVNPISDKNDESLKLYGDFPVDSPCLRVFIAKPEYLFAMKVLSMRSSLSSNDVEDLWNLWDELGIETAQQAIDLCRSFYPEKELPIRHVRILEDIESYKKNDKPYSPMIGW